MSKSLSRIQKLEAIPKDQRYPREFPGRVPISIVIESFNFDKVVKEANLQNEPSYIAPGSYKIAGRIIARRDHGNNIFFDLMEQTGEIQLHAKRLLDADELSRENIYNNDIMWEQASDCDLGDMVGIEGTIGANPRGEILFQITDWTLLAKALVEPPDKFHGITKPESRYRHRELDLLSSADSRALFKTRAEIVFEIRKYLNERDFVEIECPVLQPIYGGATARPFKTKHNALGQEFFLSISSELYLKRAMVGGFDRVYSFSRCFRNEGISPTHNPEFTNLEIFESCKNGLQMNVFTEALIKHLYNKFASTPIDYQKKLITAMPASDWPLSRSSGTSDGAGPYAEAWELYIDGMEIASGASDLNDPREQESRLKNSESNAKLESAINKEIEYDPYDQNYIEALEQGALPWAGVGIGVDRLVMLLTGKTNIRDVILFPTLKSINES